MRTFNKLIYFLFKAKKNMELYEQKKVFNFVSVFYMLINKKIPKQAKSYHPCANRKNQLP